MPGVASDVAPRRVLVVEEWAHRPVGHFPVLFADIATGLADAGHEVDVLVRSHWVHAEEWGPTPFSIHRYRWRARAAGRTWEGTALRTAGEPDRSVTLDLDSSEIGGAITMEVEPTGTGSELTVTLYARSKGLLAGVFWGVVSDAIGSGLPRQVEEFGERF